MDSEYLTRLAKIEEKEDNSQRRINEHEDRLIELEKTYSIMEKMDYRMGNVETSVKNINTKLDKDTKNKSMKWEKLIDYIFYSILAACLVIIMKKIGLQ